MALSTIQTSFLGGELSPSMYSRVDDAFYKIGASQIVNFLIRPTGILQKRPGFRLVKEFDASKKFRLIPFRFSSEQTLVLIFTDKKMYIATQGQLVLSGSSPYSITTPYKDDDLSSIEYSQNADIITLTSLNYPPYELRRYGATDWRFQTIKTTPDIQPPSSITTTSTYPDDVVNGSTDINDENYNPNTATMDVIEARYVVTAIDKNGIESEPSEASFVDCNYYIEGSTVTVSWLPVDGAESYRVYRYVSGIYGFLAETTELTITDEGGAPDTALTPPRYKDPFSGESEAGKIQSILVLDGGEDYWIGNEGSSGSHKGEIYLRTMPFVAFSDKRFREKPSVPEIEFTVKVTGTSDGSTPTGTVKYEQAYYEMTSTYDDGLVSGAAGGYTYYVTATLAPPLSIYDMNKGFRIQLDREVVMGNNTKIEIYSNRPNNTGYSEVPPSSIKNIEPAYTGMLSFAASNWSSKINYTQENLGNFIFPRYVINVNTSYTSIVFGASETDSDTYNLDLKITDSTGRGAKAQAVAKDGIIQYVLIIASGQKYTDPTVTVVNSGGTGAKFKVNLTGVGKAEYPRCSCQFDQRRIFAGSAENPLKVWMTQAGSQDLMSYHVPILDTDRIEIVAVTNDADIVKHAVALESLLLFTGSSELRVYTQNSQALSPSSVAVRAQSYVGASDVQPIVVNHSIVYVASRGGHLRQISYSYNNASYTSDDLGVRCPHMFDGKDIVDMTQSKAPIPLIYALSNDGTIKVCTYMPEQSIVGWGSFETKGTIESICAVSEGVEDRLYIMVRRQINGQERIYLERMDYTQISSNSFRCMDSFLDAFFTSPVDTLSGLEHLEGEEVCVYVDGQQQSNKVVHNGEITLDKEGQNVAVGLPVAATLVTLPIEYASASLLNHQRTISNMYLRCSGPGDVLTGVYPQLPGDKLYVCDKSEAFYAIQNNESYILPMAVTSSWDPQTQLLVRSEDCYPMELMALLCDTEYTRQARVGNSNSATY